MTFLVLASHFLYIYVALNWVSFFNEKLIMKFLILVFNYKCAAVIYIISVIILKQIYIILHTFDSGMITAMNYYMFTVKMRVLFCKLFINIVLEWYYIQYPNICLWNYFQVAKSINIIWIVLKAPTKIATTIEEIKPTIGLIYILEN